VTTSPESRLKQALSFLLTSSDYGIAVVDAKGRVAALDGRLVDGIEIGDVARDAMPFLVGLEDVSAVSADGAREPFHLPNLNFALPSGELRFVSLYLLPGEEAGAATVVLRDTTTASSQHREDMQRKNELDQTRRELETANRLLVEARDSAERATRAKSQFLAMMTHEIRTPMNGVLGMLQLLVDSELSPEQLHQARTALASGESLLRLINDILDFSKIEAGKLELEHAPFSLREVVQGTTELLAPLAQEKGIELVADVDSSVPDALVGDRGRLRQILLNLVGNAIKFTSVGGVRVAVEERGQSSARLRFSVADTGIGIPDAARAKLFDDFTQQDASTARRYGGTGLGLAIVRRLVARMKGKLGVESEPDHGSTFWFDIPYELRSTETAPASGPERDPSATGQRAAAPALRSERLLVIDDGEANRHVAHALLTRAGYSVDTVASGEEALLRLERESYSLVLTDLRMPGLDGFETAERIRSLGGAAARTPVVAMTATALQELDEDLEGAGFAGYIHKPIAKAVLLDTVERILAGEPPERAPEELAANSDLVAPQVLRDFRKSVGEEAFDRLVGVYFHEIRVRLESLPTELAARRLDSVERLAHDLKSCSAALGGLALRDRAAALEQASREADEAAAQSLVADIDRLGNETLDAVESLRRTLV
jgi:signal transduction histidine kinase/FixJ family two-component response regulator